jgi:hypothetical protein
MSVRSVTCPSSHRLSLSPPSQIKTRAALEIRRSVSVARDASTRDSDKPKLFDVVDEYLEEEAPQ